MTTLPASGYLSNAARTIAEMKQALEDLRSVIEQNLGGGAETELTIAGGNVTATRGIHNIDTEADAPSDDLDHILQTNLPDGSVVVIRPNNAGRIVVVRHGQAGAGQVLLADNANFTMNSTKMWLVLQRRGSDWHEMFRGYGDQKAAFRTFLGLTGAATTALGSSGSVLALLDSAATYSATRTFAALADIQQELRLSGDLTPAQITADQNDYNPSGLAQANVLRLSTDAFRNVTGLAGGADGRAMGVVNVGSQSVSFNDEHAGSLAANRFAIPADVTVNAESAGIIWYDSTSSRWRWLSRLVTGATQADMESENGNSSLHVTPARIKFSPGVSKAWLNFNQTTPAIVADYGVSSVSDDGAALFTPTVDTAFSAANYIAHGTVSETSAAANMSLEKVFGGTYTTTQIQMIAYRTDSAHVDLDYNAVDWKGDL